MAKKMQETKIYLGNSNSSEMTEYSLEDVIIHLDTIIPCIEEYSMLWDMEKRGIADGSKIIALGFNKNESKMMRIDAITDVVYGNESCERLENGQFIVKTDGNLFLQIRYKHKIIAMELYDIKLHNPIN